MVRKEAGKRKIQKKLALSKATLRDLAPRKDKSPAVRGARNTNVAIDCL